MKHTLVKRLPFLLIILVALLLTSCQQVADKRAEFCDTLHDVGTLATDFKSAKVDDPVDKYTAKMDALREKKKKLDRLAKIAPGQLLDKLSTATDEISQALGAISGKTLGPAAEKINAAGVKLEAVYLQLDDAVCAPK